MPRQKIGYLDVGVVRVRNRVEMLYGRHQENLGAAVASGTNITLGLDGNMFQITGTTQIDTIDATDWQSGSMVTLWFASNPVVRNGIAATAPFKSILLNAAANFGTAANNTLTLRYDGTQWNEVGRKA